MSRELGDLCKTPTLYGAELTIDSTVELRVDGAKLVHVDIVAWNGVIHGIDRLLMPVKISGRSFAVKAFRDTSCSETSIRNLFI